MTITLATKTHRTPHLLARTIQIKAGHHTTLTAQLTQSCLTLLRQANRHHLTARLLIQTTTGQTGLDKRITLAL